MCATTEVYGKEKKARDMKDVSRESDIKCFDAK